MTVQTDPQVDDQYDEEPLLKIEGLKKHFADDTGLIDRLLGRVNYVKAVDGVDLRIMENETIAVVGESGCGKSTLAETILNLNIPTDGKLYFRDKDITGLSKKEMKPYRKDIQIVFQDPLGSLNPRKQIGEIIKAPLEIHQIEESDEARINRVKQLLEEVGLKSSHYDRYPHEFSGGQQQRIAIARALTVEPDLLIADEPVSALDVSVQAQILDLLEELQDDYGLSIFFIAHDLSVVRMIADRVAVMYLGEIVEEGRTPDLFETPQHPYTKSLLSAVPKIDPEARQDRQILRGEVPSPLNPPEGCRFHTRCPVIIPPDDWAGTQEEFNKLIKFRQKILRQESYVDYLRQNTVSSDDISDEALVDYIKQEEVPLEWGKIPANTKSQLDNTIKSMVYEEKNGTKELFDDYLMSPCEIERPDKYHISGIHHSSCFRANPETPQKD